MLVLSRKKDEKIQIGDDITITVTEIRGDKVRLGIDAPKDVPIVRHNVPDAIKRKHPSAYSRKYTAYVPTIAERKLYAGLKNLYTDTAAGSLDTEAMLVADELLKEFEILA